MAQVRQDNVQIKLEIDGAQSKTELDNLTRKALVLQQGLKEMKRGTDEYIAANKELREVNTRMDELRNTLGLTGLSTGQLGKLMSQLKRELTNLVPGTEAYIAKSEELVKVENRLHELRSGLDQVRASLNSSGIGFSDFVKKAASFAGIQLGIEAVVNTFKQLGTESINAAVKGSDSISDMEKSLNVTTAEAKALRTQLEGIDTRTSQENLEDMAIAAGQLGIAKDQALAFTESVDQANVALGDEFTGGVEEVTKSLGGLQKLFKETANVSPAEAITKIGSAVNALGAEGQASGPVIADFTARIGQLGDLAPEITQTLGLGAAMQELGLSAEISSGGITNVLLTAGKETAGFAKQLNLTEKEFKNLLNADPNGVLLGLAESLKGASNDEVISTLDRLKISSQEAVKVVSLLANQTDFVRQKQALASAEYAKGTSLLDEFAKKNTNAAAEVEKSEKTFAQYRRELGEQLLPVYLKFLQYTMLVLDVLRAVPAFVSENRVAFGLLALAVASYNAAQIAAQVNTLKGLALQKLVAIGVLTEIEGKYSLVTANGALAAAQRAVNAAMTANPIAFVLTLVAAFVFGLKQLYDRSEAFRASVDSLSAMLRPLGALLGGLVAQVGPLATQMGKFFSSISGGKGILETFGALVGITVVLPIKLLITQVQLAIDQFNFFVDAGKRVANFFGASFKVDNGAFDTLTKNLKANGRSMLDTLTGQDAARAAAEKEAQRQRNLSALQELEHRTSLQLEADARRRASNQKAGAERKADDAKNDLESLKAREANIRAALALVESGSAEELRLKKLLVVTKRDIDLLGEKKTEGDKKVIRAEALRDLRALQDDYDKKTKDAAEKRAKEQAEVEKRLADLRAALLTDETEKRVQQLTAAAEKEKATAKGTAEQITEQRKLIEQKLSADITEVRRAAAQKQSEEELGIQKQQNALIVNEFERRAADLRTAAAGELLKVLDTDRNAAEKRRLIQAKLQQDLVALERDRVAQQREIAERIAQIDDSIALQRIARRRQLSNEWSVQRREADTQEQSVRQEQLFRQYSDEFIQEGLNNAQKMALSRQYLADKEALENEYADRARERDKAGAEFGLGLTSTVLQATADFEQLATDRELAKLDKDKKTRLARLDAEYKAGTVSKEAYEAQKSAIEADYDAKTRAIKKEAAEKEKTFNIAQAIIAGTLAVIKASPNVPLMIAAGATAAAGVAKIIATPIPEFEDGGVFAGRKPSVAARVGRAAGQAWRGVKEYATGGRINPTAGVADVGQRHSGGGIRMVDGATGQHLGEWEKGEAYMILSRDTYANNKHLVDELIDTSLYRGGAPVRQKPGFYEDGGLPFGAPAASTPATARADGQELAQLLRETRDAIRDLPSRQYIGWGQEDDAMIEERLGGRADDRAAGQVK
jgi:hypothetical protein